MSGNRGAGRYVRVERGAMIGRKFRIDLEKHVAEEEETQFPSLKG